MKWVEIIKLQAPQQDRTTIRRMLTRELSVLPHPEGLVAARLMQDNHVETELSLLLDWDTPTVSRAGSELGTCVVHLLEELGLTHRATWLDVTRPENHGTTNT